MKKDKCCEENYDENNYKCKNLSYEKSLKKDKCCKENYKKNCNFINDLISDSQKESKNDLINEDQDENNKNYNDEKLDFEICNNIDEKENYEKKIEKKSLNFYELIKSQDIFEGNWINNNEVKILIEEEKEIYEKIKKFSKEKNIDEENGIITLLVLYYIFSKKSEKVNELKFIINKAKLYIKKIYNLEYEEISKEFI